MGFVHPDRHDIFLSYAHVDDEPDPAFPDRPGWVTTLVRGVERRLARKLGRVDSYDLWRDAKLAGNVDVTPDILGRVRQSAVLLIILSPGYMGSPWCRDEMAAFHEEVRRRKESDGRVFVVEFDQVVREKQPPELARLRRHSFWIPDPDTGNPHTLGHPIVRESDAEYYRRLDDLCIEIVKELERLKKLEAASPTDHPQETDKRPVVYLAEATEDLEPRRLEVRRHLDQAGFRVVPESTLPLDDSTEFAEAVDSELKKAALFVQLLSEVPGRRFKGSETGYVAAQRDRAVALGKPVLQWRRRELDAASEEISSGHRALLVGKDVIASDLSEFKATVVDRLRRLSAPPTPPSPERTASDKLVFINAEETDLESARAIRESLKRSGVGSLGPVQGRTPEKTREMLRRRMLECDGMLLVHGDNSDWPVVQWLHFLKLKPERETPLRAVGLCDLPPPDRDQLAEDVLSIPRAIVIDCRDGVRPEKFGPFIDSL